MEPTSQPTQPVRATWNHSADTIIEAATAGHYPAADTEVMLASFRWSIDPRHPVAMPDFARRCGYEGNTVYKFYTNKYRHPETGEPQPPPAKFIEAAKQFLKIERERFEGGVTEFVMIPTARKIWKFCDLCRESQSPGFLSGPSQLGKTWAVENYRQANNHGRTNYCRMKASSGLGGMVRRIADSCGISDKSNTADLTERIKRGLTQDTLLILDECHLLSNTYRVNSFFACIEVIREIWDETRCGMVLIWTRIDSLKQHSERELQQIWRRGVHKLPLPSCPTRGDVAAILAHNGLVFPEPNQTITIKSAVETPAEYLRLIAKRDGLKAITERLRYGRKLAAKAGEPIDWTHVTHAHLIIESENLPADTGW